MNLHGMRRARFRPVAISSVLTREGQGWGSQLVRYTLMSTGSFLFDLGILTALVEWGETDPVVASIVGYLCAIVIDYVISIHWVFADRAFDDRRAFELGTFTAIGIAGLGVNTVVMWLVASVLGVHYAIAKLVAGLGVLLFTFVVRRAILFSRSAMTKRNRRHR
jgi:putative flippase GtrA